MASDSEHEAIAKRGAERSDSEAQAPSEIKRDGMEKEMEKKHTGLARPRPLRRNYKKRRSVAIVGVVAHVRPQSDEDGSYLWRNRKMGDAVFKEVFV